jgi:hypothetical protein
MTSHRPKQLPDLRTLPDQPSERELLSRRMKILEQRLFSLRKSDHPLSPKENPTGTNRRALATVRGTRH